MTCVRNRTNIFTGLGRRVEELVTFPRYTLEIRGISFIICTWIQGSGKPALHQQSHATQLMLDMFFQDPMGV